MMRLPVVRPRTATNGNDDTLPSHNNNTIATTGSNGNGKRSPRIIMIVLAMTFALYLVSLRRPTLTNGSVAHHGNGNGNGHTTGNRNIAILNNDIANGNGNGVDNTALCSSVLDDDKPLDWMSRITYEVERSIRYFRVMSHCTLLSRSI
jgi:hypothetical protein